jgi:hypothetical protein
MAIDDDNKKEGDEDEAEFTAKERKRLRQQLIHYERWVWFWEFLGTTGKWIAYVSAGVIAMHQVWQQLKDAFRP